MPGDSELFIETEWTVAEERSHYDSSVYPYKKETYEIIGFCMEIHRELGPGLSEVLYKDAMEVEAEFRGIPFQREKRFSVIYKGVKLKHEYVADFVINNIIVEVKAQTGIHDSAASQLINYLALSKSPVGLLLNFGESSLRFKRYILNDKRM